ncbi:MULTISPECIES: MnhB domain-containing protein [Ruegeria]|uniref:MnhB domain-containing protein n=1 Tax=Ruegeria TaxID=97050 RepID=UPI001481AA64|nr:MULTISPECIES: MnhB domain-containing protein [Ruegeria]UWR08384.1 hypothetical protein K3752_05300 [Ruegeria sp. B32]
MNDDTSPVVRLLIGALAAAISWGLAISLMRLPVGNSELADRVMEGLPDSGASHPVTAVLLNFRSYDTFLETCVLFLAVVSMWSLGPARADPATLVSTGPVLGEAGKILQPMCLLTAGYLLWVGATAPGGAFQAGAILAAGGVLALLMGWQPGARMRPWLEVGLTMGVGAFLCLATISLLSSGTLLFLNPELAKGVILAIELAATISIGLSLAAISLGGSPIYKLRDKGQ